MALQERDIFELEERLGKLLAWQREYLFAPESVKAAVGGWATGKTWCNCAAGLLLSAAYPGNMGLIGRYTETDLQDSVIPVFFEICPPSWIRRYYQAKPQHVLLRNGSQVIFRHIHDYGARITRSRRTGANLGWFFVSQAEELDIAHVNTLLGRLRRPQAKRRFALFDANPNGPDWLFQLFFEGLYSPLPPDKDWVACRRGNRLGVYARSEVNAKSRGGFVDDEYFIERRSMMPPEWVARFMDCSFEAFSGKIFTPYSLDSVHNIEPFPVPDHWPTTVGIDVGGDVPWAVGIHRFDETGNDIVTDCFHKPSVNAHEVAAWIRGHVNVDNPRTQYVIDPENKLAMLELAQILRIAIQPAKKAVRPGIIRAGGYFHVHKDTPLPGWYIETQPDRLKTKFVGHGSPRIFVFNGRASAWQKEHNGYIWDPDHPGRPRKEDDHCCDETRYVLMTRPSVADLPKIPTARDILRRTDPLSAKAHDSIDRHFEARRISQKPFGDLAELSLDSVDTHYDPFEEAYEILSRGRGIYDWED